MAFFQIREEDLTTLEKAIPELQIKISEFDKDARENIEMIKRILSDVRWDYGPYQSIERIDLADRDWDEAQDV